MKRQRKKEYYARNKDDILKRRREAREKKHASTALLNDEQNVPYTPLAMPKVKVPFYWMLIYYSNNWDEMPCTKV